MPNARTPTNSPALARSACEALLNEEIAYNLENEILPSEIAVARSLLARGDELADPYAELHDKLAPHPYALKTFLRVLLTTRAFWSPEKIRELRAERAELEAVNLAIVEHADALAALLDRRSELHNHSAFDSGTHFHVADVIAAAGARNSHFKTFLKKHLAALSGQYDLKYWPTLGDCVRVLASDAAAARLEATDPLTEASTASSRPSKSDFVLALLAHIDECRGKSVGNLPMDFLVSDGTLATLVNVLLDLSADELIDAGYIKGRRRRAKRRTPQAS